MTSPKNWEKSKMGDIGRYLNGRAFKSGEWKTTGRPIIRIQNLTGSGSEYNYFQGEVEDRYVVMPGDLLFSWSATLGTYVWQGPEAVLNQHIFKVESHIDKKFHRYLLDFKIQEMQSQTHGSGMVHITKKSFDAIEVHIPPIDEQHKIVELLEDHLSRLDAALTDVKQAKIKAAQCRRSLLQAAFTGNLDAQDSEIKTELAEDWRQERFGDIFKVKYGKAIDKSLRMEFAEYPVVGSAGVMTYTKIPLTTEPTIVIGRKGNVGSIQIFKEGCYPIDTTYYMPTIIDFDIDFLTLQLTSLELVKLDSSTATPSLRREDLENVQLVVPLMEEQMKIVALLESHLSRLDSMVELANVMEKQSTGFRRSLLQAAFTGQLTKEVVSV